MFPGQNLTERLFFLRWGKSKRWIILRTELQVCSFMLLEASIWVVTLHPVWPQSSHFSSPELCFIFYRTGMRIVCGSETFFTPGNSKNHVYLQLQLRALKKLALLNLGIETCSINPSCCPFDCLPWIPGNPTNVKISWNTWLCGFLFAAWVYKYVGCSLGK